MNTHKNARRTPHGRALLDRRVVDEGLRPEGAAQVAAMLAGAVSLGNLVLLMPVLGDDGWLRGRRLRHAGLAVLLALTLATVWPFNGFVLRWAERGTGRSRGGNAIWPRTI